MYKKYTNNIGASRRRILKIWLMIRLTTVILIATLMQVSAASLAQRVTINQKKTTLAKVFREIHRQTGYDFLYAKGLLDQKKLVDITAENEPLEQVLEKCLSGQSLAYAIEDKMIVIKEKSLIDKVLAYFGQLDVTGKIVDENGQPIAGATVKVKGTSNAVSSNDQGIFVLKNVDEKAILEITFLGFQPKEVKAAKDLGAIKMDIAIGKLEEVRVNAGYYSVKEKELTGSISRITSKEIENQPVTNVLATMQGRMAGVNITQYTGMPGSGFAIEIRGQNSMRFNGGDPLYVIDGVPYSAQSIGSNMTSGNMPAENSPLNSINPGNIESIEVLKDADATAIYGSRGANGVVLITTKKGKGGKTSFTTTYSKGIGQVAHFVDVLQTPEYLAMRREAFANDGVINYPVNAYDVNGTWDQNRNTNWQKELIGGTASYDNLQSSLSGGSEKTNFLLSGNYSKETTVFPGNFDYIKAGGQLSINHVSEDKRLKVNFSTTYTAQLNSLPAIDITSMATRLVPNSPALYDASGKLNWENNTFDNPVAPLEGKIKGETFDLLANSLLSYEIGAGFIIRSNFGYTDLNQKQLNLSPSTRLNPAFGAGSDRSIVSANTLNRSSWIIEPQVNWTRKLEKITVDALVGTTFQQQKGDKLVNYYMGFPSNSLMENPASATRILILSSDKNLYRYQALYARINFNWDGKYLVNLTGRRDGSSRFGTNKQFANFGAVGAAWLFSEEKLIKEKISFLSFGKIRASYGITGNDQIGDYQYLDTYSVSGNSYQGGAGLQPSRLFNPDFAWETNKKMELALETGFLDDRIFLTSSWFQNRSSNQLVGIPLPTTTGFSSIQANLDATVQNSGVEFSLRTVNMKRRNFSWTTSFTLTSSENKLLSFPGLESSTYKNQYVIGESLNIRKRYHYTGLNPVTGTYQFKDVNNDGIISSVADAKTNMDLNPQYYGGLQNQLQYGGFNLDFLFQFVKQQNITQTSITPMPGTMVNQPREIISRWQNAGDLGPYQGYSDSNGNRQSAYSNFTQSDAGISDASYIRLKNISLSYVLPERWTRKFTCRVSLQGQNVFTFTKYKGLDPEFMYSGGYLPPLRVYTSSIQLTF